jgi:type I restriction enzyme S subunit
MEAEICALAPSDWQIRSVEDVCKRVTSGGTPSRTRPDFYVDGSWPWVKTQELQDTWIDHTDEKITDEAVANSSAKVLPPNTILLAMYGATVGQLGILRSPMTCNQACCAMVVDSDKADFRYLYHHLRYSRTQLKSLATGAAQQNLSGALIKSLLYPFPPLAEQKAIAAVLGALDDKIELNRRMNATLEAMARALFQSWFVDFDPVRAKLDGRPPAALDPATAALFPGHFAHGEHEMLPIGWRLGAIEEVCALNAWTLGKNDDLEMLEYVEISEVSRGNIANIATYPRGEEPSRARRRLRHGDTALSTVRPDRGSYFLALNPPENRVASTGFAVLTPTKVPWSFLHAALTQPEVSDHLGQMADGGAYPAVRPEIIGAMQVALPNEPKILDAFHRRCAPLFEQAEANRTESRTLATLRDTLLPKLLSGELSVPATDKESLSVQNPSKGG